MILEDDVFLSEFESLELSPDHFDHLGHLRLAWLYLRRHPMEQAVEKVASGIKAYASSLGATDKFQHTLTEAIVRIMASRPGIRSVQSLEAYLGANKDLVDNIWGVVNQYYSKELLQSRTARERFVEPDLQPLAPAA